MSYYIYNIIYIHNMSLPLLALTFSVNLALWTGQQWPLADNGSAPIPVAVTLVG